MLSTASDESGRDIKLRTMSWKKTAAVLFGEYVCIAILSFPSSFMALGYVGGIIATLSIGVVTLYTSLTLWKFQMKHPECRDICDIGYKLFGNSRIAYELTTFGLLANNLMILGLHTSTGAKVFDTLTNSQYCNIIWAIVTMVICILLSLPRTLTQVSFQSIISASKSQSIWKCVGL
jgi:amino acid permease